MRQDAHITTLMYADMSGIMRMPEGDFKSTSTFTAVIDEIPTTIMTDQISGNVLEVSSNSMSTTNDDEAVTITTVTSVTNV